MVRVSQTCGPQPPADSSYSLSLCAQTRSFHVSGKSPFCLSLLRIWSSLVLFLLKSAGKNLAGERTKSIPQSLASFKSHIILMQCNLKSSTLTGPVPSATWFYSQEFVSWSPSSSSKSSCQHPGNICLGISTTVWSCCSPVWDVCLQRKSVQQQHRERKKRRKRGFI